MKYLGYYGDGTRKDVSPAAVSKMDYIVSCLERLGNQVNIISCSIYGDKRGKKFQNNVKYFFTYSKRGGKIVSKIRLLLLYIRLFFYLIKNTKKDEIILAYHSVYYMKPIQLAKKVKKFILILEVEEFYNDVVMIKEGSFKDEEAFIKEADRYIFSTRLIEEQFNTKNKPYVIAHGNYGICVRKQSRFDDSLIHVVYAGTFDMTKGGAVSAINAAYYLDEKYCIHILGFGSKEQIENVKHLVEEAALNCKCKIIYEGLKTGEEYTSFLSKCHIGLSTQNPEAKYNESSFPSKILSYLGCGLRVVTVKIPVIETSDISEIMTYYKGASPKVIAKAIESVSLDEKFDSIDFLRMLDRRFLKSMKELIAEL